MTTSTPELVLASASPRRKQLLDQLGLTFRVFASHVHEEVDEKSPEDAVIEVAHRKAAAADDQLPPLAPGARRLVIGADTVVFDHGEILGKPGNPAAARAMLRRLSGTEHRVLTGLALLLRSAPRPDEPAAENSPESWVECFEETKVRFARLSDEEIDRYAATGEPLDKAGGYGIQALASVFVESISGDYYNVVGLPLRRLYLAAREHGIDLLKLREEGRD